MWFLVFVMMGCLPALPALAATEAELRFDEALTCYNEINFDCALEKLKAARDAELAGAADSDALVRIYRYMAYSQVALGEIMAARESFRQILLLKPSFSLQPSKVSPKIYNLYLQVKNENERPEPEPPEPEPVAPPPLAIRPEPEPQPEPQSEPEAPPASSWRLRPNASAVFPLGEDTDYNLPGLGLDLAFSYRITAGFWLGAGMGYRFLPGKAGFGDVHLLGGELTAGYLWQMGDFEFELGGALGLAGFGRDAVADDIVMIWRVQPVAWWRLGERFALGLVLGPEGAIRLDKRAASFLFVTGVAGSFEW